MDARTGTENAPGTAADPRMLEGLNDLLQLNHDAIGAYDIAIEKLKDADHASQISGFRMDHERHVRELNQAIQMLGGTPVNEPHATGPLKEAMQALGAVAGDRGTLLSWRANELQVRTKYDTYAAQAVRWPAEIKRMIDEQALDEERHYRWGADVLASMGVGSGEGIETHAANTMRERVESASARVDRLKGGLRDRADELGDRVERATERAQELTGRARHRADVAAHYIRDADGEMLRGELEDRVRSNPLQTLLLMFGVGFVIGRILR